MRKYCVENNRGITLMELMAVLVILSVVMVAVYSLYFTHQRTAYTQEEVVEVQQNVRIGMDSITRDIRMAGFLIPFNTTPVITTNDNTGIAQPLSAPDNINSDSITINTSSASGAIARIVQAPAGAELIVEDPASVDLFTTTNVVTIIRPGNRTLPSGATFLVSGMSRTVPSITLGSTPGGVIVPGDLIVRLGAGGNYPNTITYCLGPSALPAPNGCGNGVDTCPGGQLCLMRIINIGLGGQDTQLIAQNMVGLQMSYLLDNGTETSAPNASQLGTIRSVRVTLIGQTAKTIALSDNIPKQRRLESVIMMRNR